MIVFKVKLSCEARANVLRVDDVVASLGDKSRAAGDLGVTISDARNLVAKRWNFQRHLILEERFFQEENEITSVEHEWILVESGVCGSV